MKSLTKRSGLFLIVGLICSTALAVKVKEEFQAPGIDTQGNINFTDADQGDQDISGPGVVKAKLNERNGKVVAKGRARVTNNSGAKFKSDGQDAVDAAQQIADDVIQQVDDTLAAEVDSASVKVSKKGKAKFAGKGTIVLEVF